jgi:hypothetical protein
MLSTSATRRSTISSWYGYRAASTADLLSAEFQCRTIDSVELPPSRFIITDPLLIGLAVFALFQLPGAGGRDRATVVSVLVGLLIPGFWS